MRIDIISIFPEYLEPLNLSLIGKARAAGVLEIAVHDLREATNDRHRTVDDAPLGGGAGMVMSAQPWADAVERCVSAGRAGLGNVDALPTVIVPAPSGEVFTQQTARELSGHPWLMFGCGRYEGIDERLLEHLASWLPLRTISLGDYVLNGGEVAALAIIEAVARLVPGVVGNAQSLVEESHEGGLLEYPVYTRPSSWRGRDVPAVLLSGHHAQIERWRRDQRLIRTATRRPDLLLRLDPRGLDPADLAVLASCGWVPGASGFQSGAPGMAH